MPGSNQRSLDDERARPAHRVKKLNSQRRKLRPSRTDEHTRRDVLLQRSLTRSTSIAAAVKTLPGEIERDGDVISVRMRVHPNARAFDMDVRTRARLVTEIVDNRILQLQRPE